MPLDTHVGSPRSRVDGRLKVTGAAKYAAEYNVPGLLIGYVVSSPIAKGRLVRIDTAADQGAQRTIAFIQAERGAFARRAEQHNAIHALCGQTVYMRGEPGAIDTAIRTQGGQAGAPQSSYRGRFHHGE